MSFQVTIVIKRVLMSLYLCRCRHVSIATAWVDTPDNKVCETRKQRSALFLLSYLLVFILFFSLFVPDGYANLHVLISIELSVETWREWIIKGSVNLFIPQCYSWQSLSPELWWDSLFPSWPFGSLGKKTSKYFHFW